MNKIGVKPDMTIEPGHQWLVLDATLESYYLARILTGDHSQISNEAGMILVPHTHAVDKAIVDLINALAHVRFLAPTLMQLTLSVPQDDDGLEGA